MLSCTEIYLEHNFAYLGWAARWVSRWVSRWTWWWVGRWVGQYYRLAGGPSGVAIVVDIKAIAGIVIEA